MTDLRRFLPSPQTVKSNRWLRWLGPALHHPRLWHMNRHGLALGMALGVFFGLLVPLAQIPVSAAAAVALRANLPAAVASTLVTNPVTYGPVYYAAWRLGRSLLGDEVRADEVPPKLPTAAEAEAAADSRAGASAFGRIVGVGKPLLLGLAVFATSLGLATYFVVSWLWALRVHWKRRRRRRARAVSAP